MSQAESGRSVSATSGPIEISDPINAKSISTHQACAVLLCCLIMFLDGFDIQTMS